MFPPLPSPASPAQQAALHDLHALHDATLAARALRDQGQQPDTDALRALLRAAERSTALAPAPHDPILDAEAREAIAAGALRLLYYRQTVHARRPLLDTLGSKTLPEFEPDLTIRDERDAQTWRAAICRVCAMTPDQLDALESRLLGPELAELSQRLRLMDALDDHLGLPTRGRQGAHALLAALFPGNPLKVEEVDLIRTSTAVYLCLPYDARGWTTRGEEQHDDPALTSLLRRITRPAQATMAHFPAFAPLRKAELDPALVRALADHTGVTAEQIRAQLPTMITILPRDEVDKYIVHDVWGHLWQAHLFDFEHAYQRVAKLASAPPISAAMLDALAAHIDQDPDARPLWSAALDAHLDRALRDSLTGLFAEVLADAVEYKFLVLNPTRRADLLSSSFFKELPTKLDLTLADLPLYFRFASRGARRLCAPDTRQPLLDQLAQRLPHAADAQLHAALDDAHAWTLAALDDPTTWAALPAPAPHANAFDLAALAFSHLQLTFNALHADLNPTPPHPLLARPHDLIIFAAASFFEQDPDRNLARIPALLAILADLEL
jgi:hypothetical protein